VRRASVKATVTKALIDFRFITEVVVAVALAVVFVMATSAANFSETLSDGRRGTLYASLAGTSAALLGFVLAALSVLVALPSSERMDALRGHPRWERVPSSYFRAARALLAALVISTLGIALDSARKPWRAYEILMVGALVLSLVRVAAALVALDAILGVARQREPRARPIDDPGL